MNNQVRPKYFLYNVLNQETVFQEYFCNLLAIDSFRNKFLQFISKKNNILESKNIQFHNFSTEVILDNNCGRADLYLELENKEVFIFEIKNKHGTQLTDNQPLNYLKYLCGKNHHLFFLIPKYYKHKNDIITSWKKELKDKNFDIEKQLFYWDDFIDFIENEDDPYVKAFYDFCINWFVNSVKFTSEELKILGEENMSEDMKVVPSLMQKLEIIIMNIGDNTNGFKFYHAPSGYVYSKIIGKYEIFFGIDYSIWEKTKNPINVMIYLKDNYSEKFPTPELNTLKISLYEIPETNYFDKQFLYVVNLDFNSYCNEYEDKLRHILDRTVLELEKLVQKT